MTRKLGLNPSSPSSAGTKLGRRSEHQRMRTGENLSPVVIPGFNQSSPQVRFRSEAQLKDLKTDRATPSPVTDDSQKKPINEE